MTRSRIPAYAAAVLLCLVSMLAVAAPARSVSQEVQKQYDLALDQAINHYEQFKIFLENKEDAKALKELQAIVDIDFPKGFDGSDGVLLQVDAHILLGEMLIEQAEKEKDAKKKKDLLSRAIETIKAGLHKSPDVHELTYDLYMALGHAYKVSGRSEDALDAFKAAEKINKKLQDNQKQQKNS